MQPRRIDAEFTDLMTSDGVPIDFHAVITLQVIDSVKLVRDFGADIGQRTGRRASGSATSISRFAPRCAMRSRRTA